MRGSEAVRAGVAALVVGLASFAAFAACREPEIAAIDTVAGAKGGSAADSRLVAQGREIFRHDDFGNWRFWTDTCCG